jgi:hypothetical protein
MTLLRRAITSIARVDITVSLAVLVLALIMLIVS